MWTVPKQSFYPSDEIRGLDRNPRGEIWGLDRNSSGYMGGGGGGQRPVLSGAQAFF